MRHPSFSAAAKRERAAAAKGIGFRMAGITPPSDDRSRSSRLADSSFSEPDLAPPPDLSLVPAAATLVQGQRPPGSRPPLVTISTGRDRRQDSSSSPSPRGTQRPTELSATQASFLAGAAVTHAHQSAQVALHAANTAQAQAASSQAQAQQVAQQASEWAQGVRQEAQSVVDQTRAEAQAAVTQTRVEAQTVVDQTRAQAQAEVTQVRAEANQAVLHTRAAAQEEVVAAQRTALERIALLEQELLQSRREREESNRRIEQLIAERRLADDYWTRREAELNQQLGIACSGGTPPATNRASHWPPMSFSPDTQSHNGPAPSTPLPVARAGATPSGSPVGTQGQGHNSPKQAPSQEGAATSAPAASAAQPAEQPAALSSEAPPAQAEAVTVQSGSSSNPEVAALSHQVSELLTTVHSLAQAMATLQQPTAAPSSAPPPPTTAAATVPTLSFPAPAAPLLLPASPRPASEASSESSSSSEGTPRPPACRVCGSRAHLEVDCPQLSANGGGGDGGGGGSPSGSGRRLPPAASPGRDAAPSAPEEPQTPADYEETVIRIKSLSDMTFPQPPTNAGQARGYVNQVLVAIARVQRTPGDEVYLWAQECLTHTEAQLRQDPRFPRLTREVSAKLLKTCKSGRFGLMFQQMTEAERMSTGGMPNGRVMLRAIFKHFQLERDRIGMLGERNLLGIKMQGTDVSALESFRDKYLYVLTTIPIDELPRPQTMFNHLLDELEKNSIMKARCEKAREATGGSHRRTTEWLWSKVEIALQLHQQKVNREEFDKNLRAKPQVLTSTATTGKDQVPATPAPKAAPKGAADKPPRKEKKNKKNKKDKDKDEEVPAAPAPKGAPKGGKGKGKGDNPKSPRTPRGGKGGDTTPRSAEVKRVKDMTAAEKKKTPCMFYAHGMCKADPCPFLHDDKKKYTGPPPRAAAKPKAKAKANAAIAAVIPAMPASNLASDTDCNVTWLWDTAAGRHLIGRQALSSDMRACVRTTSTPVGFATGGGAQHCSQSLSFGGSKLVPQEEQVYVLKECPPALSVGKAVQDQGCLFVWDPKESGPYFVPASEVHRCRLKVPRGARLNASRVVEYVPQFDERLSPVVHQPVEQLSPVEAAASPSAVESDAVSVVDEGIGLSAEELAEYAPTEVATSDDEKLEAGYLEEADDFATRVGAQFFRSSAEGSAPPGARESAAVEPPSLEEFADLFKEGAAEGAPAPEKPVHRAAVDPEDQKPLIDLVDPKSLEPSKRDTLMAEAKSAKHLLTHFPKNPFCRVCSLAKTTSMKVARKPDAKSDDLIDAPTGPWQQIATDDVIMARGDDHRGIGTGGVKSHHVVRDVFSGARVAYPMSRRTLQHHSKNFRHFFGLRPTAKPPVCLVKMDEAGELEGAATEVGLIPETSLPNRWPHNAVLERDVREEKECCRSIHLQSGLPYDFHTYSFPYACLSLSFDRASHSDKTKSQWEVLTKSPFEGIRVCFGQLVYYRKKGPSTRALDPNLQPGLFLGWRLDAGMRYRFVTKVLDYAEFRAKRNTLVVDVPQDELFVEEGPPVFPVANANRRALVEGAAEGELPEIPLKEVPFPPEGSDDKPLPREPKARSVYITVERIIKFKETPGCKACYGKAAIHTPECRKRFTELVEKERKEKEERRSLPPTPGRSVPPTPAETVPPTPAAESVAPPTPAAVPEAPVRGEAEVSSVAGAAVPSVTATSTKLAEATGDQPPVFGVPAGVSPKPAPQQKPVFQKGTNRRARRAKAKGKSLTTVFEYDCSPSSVFGKTNAELSVPHLRLSRKFFDLEDNCVQAQISDQLTAITNAHLWGALPNLIGCRRRDGDASKRRWLAQLVKFRSSFQAFASHAQHAVQRGHDCTLVWPTSSECWRRPEVKEFLSKHTSSWHKVEVSGCNFGWWGKDDKPLHASFRFYTTSARLVEVLGKFQEEHKVEVCSKNKGSTQHVPTELPALCRHIVLAINPSAQTPVAPAMPVVPVQEQQQHREKEQALKHISPLAGLDDFAAVIESDPTSKQIVEEIVDLNGLVSQVCGLEPETQSSPEVSAMVTKLLSRAEMLASPEALAALRSEADGLRSVPVWDESNPREYAEVQKEAKHTGAKVHFGRLMTIVSIKFYELAKHLQKLKGRIVYRGDCAKDEYGAAAVYQELGANPTSVQGLNNCLAYGALQGHATTTSDAIKAYVQALLKSKHQTWIELPPELRPKWWREKFARPVVLLLRALYGHPDAGGLWEQHLARIIKGLGGREISEFPGNYWFPNRKLLLSTYVDDLTLSGPEAEHQAFWDELTALVDVEPPEPVFRVLGRNHYIVDVGSEAEDMPSVSASKNAMAFDMVDYTQQTVDLYLSLTGSKKLKNVQTPFCPEGSLPPSDDEVTGELAPAACKLLMKALWLGRLSRPDIIKPIGDLATCVQKWSRNNDRQAHRLICYIDSTKLHRLVGHVDDCPDDLKLSLYVDADFAGEKAHARRGVLSTSGP